MKRVAYGPVIGLLFASLFALLGLPAQQSATEQTRAAAPAKDSILIVYLSRTKNTEAVARMIHRFNGGRMVAVELEKPYPGDYRAIVQQVDRENETGVLPPIKTKIEDIGRYQTVFVGFPTWDMTLPPPMKRFLTSHDLKGKVVVPFNTHAGYGVGSGFQKVKELCPRSRVVEGFSTKGGIERDGVMFVMEGEKAEEVEKKVGEWLRQIGMPISR